MKILSHDEAYDSNVYNDEFLQAHRTIEFPDGFRQLLEGKSIEEQMKYYGIVENMYFTKSYYGETENTRGYECSVPLAESNLVKGLIVEDGILEGVIMKGYWGERPAAPYDIVTTYYASDNEGSGYNDREDTAVLLCLPPELVK